MPQAETNDPILKEIREEYERYRLEWEPIHEDGKEDALMCAGDPWEEKARRERVENSRPALSPDELNQYLNALQNDPKQNPRGIKINPRGQGADAQSAELWENIIREIEYRSHGQVVYANAFDGECERGYGYLAVGSRYEANDVSPDQDADAGLFQQELYLRLIQNPDSVMFEPNFKERDASDAEGCFIVDKLTQRAYKRKWPKAKPVDFGEKNSWPDGIKGYWFEGGVLVVEYWKIVHTDTKLLLMGDRDNPVAIWADQFEKLREDKRGEVIRERTADRRTVRQYIANGLDVLEQTDVPVSIIPVVPMWGKMKFIDRGGGAKRELWSLVRAARDAYRVYCALVSNELELIGMTPKTPYIGAEGQFAGRETEWQNSTKVPTAFLQYKIVMDQTGDKPIPPPQRQSYEPPIQAMELAIEGARRRIQSSIGVNPLPTMAQKLNEKSGTALKQIQDQEDTGSFHFIANYNLAIEKTGRILLEWGKEIYQGEREIGIRKADGSHQLIRINDAAFQEPGENGQMVQKLYNTDTGTHGVTVSVGPSFESQRQEAADFIETLVSNIQAIAQFLPPPVVAKMLSLLIQVKQIGPLGDELADTISPPPNEQAQQQQMGQLQQQNQAAQKLVQDLQVEIQQLKLEKAGKVVEGQWKQIIQRMKDTSDQLVEAMKSNHEANMNQLQQAHERFLAGHQSAHEAASQRVEHAHAAATAAAGAAANSAQSAQDHTQNLEASASEPAPNGPQGAV